MREGRIGGHFARIRITLVTARARAHKPKMIRVAVCGVGEEACPVSTGILRHQQIGGLASPRRTPEDAVDIDRSRSWRPRAKCRASSVCEMGSHRSSWQNIRLRNHERPSRGQELNSGVLNGEDRARISYASSTAGVWPTRSNARLVA